MINQIACLLSYGYMNERQQTSTHALTISDF